MKEDRSIFGCIKEVLFAATDATVSATNVVKHVAGGCEQYSASFEDMAKIDRKYDKVKAKQRLAKLKEKHPEMDISLEEAKDDV